MNPEGFDCQTLPLNWKIEIILFTYYLKCAMRGASARIHPSPSRQLGCPCIAMFGISAGEESTKTMPPLKKQKRGGGWKCQKKAKNKMTGSLSPGWGKKCAVSWGVSYENLFPDCCFQIIRLKKPREQKNILDGNFSRWAICDGSVYGIDY